MIFNATFQDELAYITTGLYLTPNNYQGGNVVYTAELGFDIFPGSDLVYVQCAGEELEDFIAWSLFIDLNEDAEKYGYKLRKLELIEE